MKDAMVTATQDSAVCQNNSQVMSMAWLVGERIPAAQMMEMMIMKMERQREKPRMNFCRSLIRICEIR